MDDLPLSLTLVLASLAVYPLLALVGLTLAVCRAPEWVRNAVGGTAIILSAVLLVVAVLVDPFDPSWGAVY